MGCCIFHFVSWLEQLQVSLLKGSLSDGQLRQQVLVRLVPAPGWEEPARGCLSEWMLLSVCPNVCVQPLQLSLTSLPLNCRIRASARLAFAGYAVDIPVT